MLFPHIFGHNDCFHRPQGLARRLHCSGYRIAVELLNITLMFVRATKVSSLSRGLDGRIVMDIRDPARAQDQPDTAETKGVNQISLNRILVPINA